MPRKNPTAIGTSHAYTHGTAQIVAFELGDLGAVRRIELYTPNDDGDDSRDRVFAVDRNDASPRVDHRRFYDGHRCASCYLGHAHTVAKHEANIAGHEESVRAHVARRNHPTF